MQTVNVAGLAGTGLLVNGAMLSVSDLSLFDTPYALIMGPISWIVGCALMVAWAVGRVALAVGHGSEAQKRVDRTRGQPPRASVRGRLYDVELSQSPTRIRSNYGERGRAACHLAHAFVISCCYRPATRRRTSIGSGLTQ